MRSFFCLACLFAAALTGCVHVPSVPENISPEAGAEITVDDARGKLSRRETTALLKRLAAQAPDADAMERHLVIEQAVSGRPLYSGNRVTALRDGPETFAATADAIRRAQHYIYLEYYILEAVSLDGQPLSDLLIERHQQGVQIDILYDSVGSMSTPREFFDRLSAAGIHVRPFNPFDPLSPYSSLNSRDHRKILIVDSEVAIIGGVNLSTAYQSSGGSSLDHDDPPPPPAHDAYREPWHDTDLEIEGPAVRELKRLFEQHWNSQGGSADELVPATQALESKGDQVIRIIGSVHGPLAPRYYETVLAGIRSASNHVWVTAAYFVPTHDERQALELAARRGVDVRLLLPSHSDSAAALAVQQSYYGSLLAAGVKIFERDDGILHSKTIVVDGVWSLVGSSNFDHRSVLFNDEVDAVVIGPKTGERLEQYFTDGEQHSHQVDAKTWTERPLTHKVRERFWRLWEQWL
jgi:cardiolipin synthase